MDRCYDIISFILRKPSVAIFAEIIKIVIMFIKTIFKDLKEVKILRNYIPIFSIYLYFLI